MDKEFKFNIGDTVMTPIGEGEIMDWSTSTIHPSPMPVYTVKFSIFPKKDYEERFSEVNLSLVEVKKPLDSNGVEIEVGDLVIHPSKEYVGRISYFEDLVDIHCIHKELKIWIVPLWYPKIIPGGAIFTKTPKNLTILEKAPKKTIVLGSLVRVKETGEEFRVHSGYKGSYGCKGSFWARSVIGTTHYSELTLELIE